METSTKQIEDFFKGRISLDKCNLLLDKFLKSTTELLDLSKETLCGELIQRGRQWSNVCESCGKAERFFPAWPFCEKCLKAIESNSLIVESLIDSVDRHNKLNMLSFANKEIVPKNSLRRKIAKKYFRRCDWSGSIIRNIDFSGCHFDKNSFAGSTFEKCNFKNTTFNNCGISFAEFNECNFTSIDFSTTKILVSFFFKTRLTRSCRISSTSFLCTSFNNCTLEDIDFVGKASDITNSVFENCKFKGIDFSPVELAKIIDGNTKSVAISGKHTEVEDLLVTRSQHQAFWIDPKIPSRNKIMKIAVYLPNRASTSKTLIRRARKIYFGTDDILSLIANCTGTALLVGFVYSIIRSFLSEATPFFVHLLYASIVTLLILITLSIVVLVRTFCHMRKGVVGIREIM